MVHFIKRTVVLLLILCMFMPAAQARMSIGGQIECSSNVLEVGKQTTFYWSFWPLSSSYSARIYIYAVKASGAKIELVDEHTTSSVSGSKTVTIPDADYVEGYVRVSYTNRNPEMFASKQVKIHNPIKFLFFKPSDTVEICAGDQYVSHLEITPENASDPRVTYSSKDESIAVVDENGVVTAIAPGRTSIYADALDGSGVRGYLFVNVIQHHALRLPGDANDDGQVNIMDALLVLQHDVGWQVEINQINADVNADDKADIIDALLIMQYDVGWDIELL